jgi:hypothetical protein
MRKNDSKPIPYENEPENYSKLRDQILSLMVKINECKKEAAKILNNDILAEEYGDDPNGIISDLNGVVRFLGDAHGFLLSDDVIQEVLPG